MLTSSQLLTLKAAIAAESDQELVSLRDSGATGAMAEWYNRPSTAVVWKTLLTEHQITGEVSPSGTTWSWTAYIARSEPERSAWGRMFNGTYTINPSLPQVRTGITDIFSGGTGAAQRAHLLAMGKRFAKRGEALFASGLKTDVEPGTLVLEGNITSDDIVMAIS
jgi:hypothetical protein